MTTLYELGATTIADYRLHTGDTTTEASAVSASLVEAEQLLEEELRRRLPSMERTDSFKIYPDGRLYPDAWPITDADLTIEGRALLGATPTGGTFTAAWTTTTAPRAEVTWTGGFTADTLPRTLAHAIYDLARALTSPATSRIPVGATSVRLGDAAIAGSSWSGGLDGHVPGLSARVAKYRARWVG